MREHLKETEATEWFEKRHDRAFSKQSHICMQCVVESTCSVTWYCHTLNLEYSTNASSFLLDNIVGLFEKGNLPSSSTQWHFNPREHQYLKFLNRFKDDFQGKFYAIRHHYSERQWNPGGMVLPIMAYTGRLRPKGVPFSGFRYMKG